MNVSANTLIVGGIIVVVVGWFVAGWQLRRADKRDATIVARSYTAGNSVWAALTPKEKEALSSKKTRIEQEDWIDANVPAGLMGTLNAERLIVELANQGVILLGLGSPRRSASPLDYVQHDAQQKKATEKPHESFQQSTRNVKSTVKRKKQEQRKENAKSGRAMRKIREYNIRRLN
jgi:hypothetical protein